MVREALRPLAVSHFAALTMVQPAIPAYTALPSTRAACHAPSSSCRPPVDHRLKRGFRGLIALAAWTGLGLQLWIKLTSGDFDTAGAALWSFV
ncbi:MAG: hypothetical protein EA421_12595, partial [Gemmatimonadales bacterium]